MRQVAVIIWGLAVLGVLAPVIIGFDGIQGQDQSYVRTERKANRPAIDLLKDCAACHSLTAEKSVVHGPSLYGLFGRPVAGDPDYAYSEALASHGGVWDRGALMGFLERPDYYARETKMHFRGIRDFQERRRLILWFEQQRQAIDRLGKGPKSLELLLAEGRADEGQRLARRCAQCHVMQPVGTASKSGTMARTTKRQSIGPPLTDLLGRPVASVPDYSYQSPHYDRDQVWTKEKLNRFLLAPTRLDFGAHIGFRALKHARDRADLIAYLASLKPESTDHQAQAAARED